MKTISVFDTSTIAYNIGNEIIMDAVMCQLDSLFPEDFIIRLPTDDIGKKSRWYNRLSQYSFVGGTNVLNGDIRHYRQWDLRLHNILILRNLVLMGCGWFQYEAKCPTPFTRWALSKVLAKNMLHSVRDNYTLEKCKSLRLKDINFINTGCPTLWMLDDAVISKIPQSKSSDVVFTITDYNMNSARDKMLIQQLRDNYKNLYLFPQGRSDLEYISSIGELHDIVIIRPRLKDFDTILDSGADYVGTRLHAGIRALQHSCRSLIIGIDNRATEMSIDFKLPVIAASDIKMLDNKINSSYNLSLSIPWDNITRWKEQFNEILS